MYHRAAILALLLETIPPAVSQQPVTLRSSSHVVQMDVSVSDRSGQPVRGLQANDFVITDNGHPREIRIFSGDMEAAGAYSNRFGLRDSPMVTAIVIDAVPRPEGLQKNGGGFGDRRQEISSYPVRARAMGAIRRLAPGQIMAIYAACPELRVVQDYTSDSDRLVASLQAFAPPPPPKDSKGQPSTIEQLVPPMLSVLRDVAGRMAGASGHKSVVWVSQGYGIDLNLPAIGDVTDAAVDAFNDQNVRLYAVDGRFNPTCQTPTGFSKIPDGGRVEREEIAILTCSQPPDVSDEWMQYFAENTGGRAFHGGKVFGITGREPPSMPGGIASWSSYQMQGSGSGMVSDAMRFAVDDSRSAYQMGFYVPETELDGKVHGLRVEVRGKPKLEVRYRGTYTASASATAPAGVRESTARLEQVGIDARVDLAGKNGLQVSVELAPATVTRTADGVVALGAVIIQADGSGKELAKVEEEVRVPAPGTASDMVRYGRALKLVNGALLLRVTIRDQATSRVGTVVVPIGRP